MQLMATKLVGFRSRAGVTSSLQATHTNTDYKLWDLMVEWSLIPGPGTNVVQHFSAFMLTEGLHVRSPPLQIASVSFYRTLIIHQLKVEEKDFDRA